MTRTALEQLRHEQGLKNRPQPAPPPPDTSPKGTILVQTQRREARPGSQRRCYNGCFPSSDWETMWGEWRTLTSDVPESTLSAWPDFSRDGLKTRYKWEPNQ